MKFNRRAVFPSILVLLGLFLIISSVYWSAISGSQHVSNSPASVISNLPFPDVPRVLLREAQEAFEEKTAIFLDVRGEPYYSQGHIPGAISISEDELLDRIGELSLSAWIITYCA